MKLATDVSTGQLPGVLRNEQLFNYWFSLFFFLDPHTNVTLERSRWSLDTQETEPHANTICKASTQCPVRPDQTRRPSWILRRRLPDAERSLLDGQGRYLLYKRSHWNTKTDSHRNVIKFILSFLLTLLLQWSKSVKICIILPKIYLLHLKVEHCQTLRAVRTFTGQNVSTVFDL